MEDFIRTVLLMNDRVQGLSFSSWLAKKRNMVKVFFYQCGGKDESSKLPLGGRAVAHPLSPAILVQACGRKIILY